MKGRLLRIAWSLGLYRPPDRRVLEDDILPWLGAAASKASADRAAILFVGVKSYNVHYARFAVPAAFFTLDPEPEHARFGAQQAGRHRVGRIEDARDLYAPESFDAVVLNGVIGYGLNAREDVNRAFVCIAHLLRAAGTLVVGINESLATHVPLGTMPAAAGLFESRSRIDLLSPFSQGSHSFLFFEKRS